MGYTVDKFFKSIGFKRPGRNEDHVDFIRKNLPYNIGYKLVTMMDTLSEHDSSYRREFYSLKNSSLDTSLCVTNAVEYSYFSNLLQYLEDNVDEIGDNVLFIGCDCGIEPCFLASIKPSAKITAIDISESAIENARELSKRLDVNVNFKCVSCFDLNGKFDTIISIRAAHEIATTDSTMEYMFEPLERKRLLYKNDVINYATCLGRLLDDYGVLISLERFYDVKHLSWMDALSSNGIETIEINEVKGKDTNYWVTFAQKCDFEYTYEQVWFCHYSGDNDYGGAQFKDVQSEIFIALMAGELIKGYYAQKDSAKCARFALYRHKNDDTAIIFENYNFSDCDSYVFDTSDLDNALKSLEDLKKAYEAQGAEMLKISRV